ncbi:hypothetical protein PUN28_020288, partial [Cardiocondyla obscurior]
GTNALFLTMRIERPILIFFFFHSFSSSSLFFLFPSFLLLGPIMASSFVRTAASRGPTHPTIGWPRESGPHAVYRTYEFASPAIGRENFFFSASLSLPLGSLTRVHRQKQSAEGYISDLTGYTRCSQSTVPTRVCKHLEQHV